MKRAARILWPAIALVLVISLPLPQSALADDWRPIAEGVEYQEYLLPGLVRVYVARMDRSNPNVTLETSLAGGELESDKDTVSGMVETYDETLSYWEPDLGARMKVVAAINGSFFNLETGVPHSGMVQGGSYIKKFGDLGGGSGFVWRLDRFAFIGGCVNHPADEQLLTVLHSGETYPIRAINNLGKVNSIAVFTHQYDRRTPDRAGMEVHVALDGPFSILSQPEMATGTVTSFSSGGNSPIAFDEIVLRPRRSAANWVKQNMAVGDRIGISMAIDHYQDDCQSHRGERWQEAYSSLSGSFVFLVDGEIRTFYDDVGATIADPRTAICFNDDFLHFIVVDGRQDGFSYGLTIDQLAHFCRDRLEADWGINQDGGGSSALWIDGEIVNRPSDGHERAVANGLMMVNLLPKESSQTFHVGDHVRANHLIDMSMGPGDLFQTPIDAGQGDVGVIIDERHALQGVLATGSYWWKVDFDGRMGWVRESSLELASSAEPTQSAEPTSTPALDDPNTMMNSLNWLLGRALHRMPTRPIIP